jgi:hypothetical protein
MRNYINEHWNWIPLKARRLASYSCYAVFHDPKEVTSKCFQTTQKKFRVQIIGKKER